MKPIRSNKALAALLFSAFCGAIAAKAQTTPAPQPNICQRSCWSARAGSCTTTMSSLTRAIIHHTAGSSDYTTDLETAKTRMRGIQNLHMDSNGWCDIAYHFLVDAGGHIFEGRAGSMSTLIRGSHAGCGNTDTFGFTFLGYFHTPYNHVPPVAMRNAMYSVIAWRMPSGWNPYGSRTSYSGSLNGTAAPIDTHRWVGAKPSTSCAYTACPGDNIANFYGMGTFTSGEFRRSVAIMRGESLGTIVDNTSANFTASANWTDSTSVPGYYGSNYKARATFEGSDVATWSASLSPAGNYHLYARWTAHANRDNTTGYYVDHSSGYTRVDVNQQENGSMWQFLGTYNLNSGNNTIRLSCWSPAGQYVIADAVRWVKE